MQCDAIKMKTPHVFFVRSQKLLNLTRTLIKVTKKLLDLK